MSDGRRFVVTDAAHRAFYALDRVAPADLPAERPVGHPLCWWADSHDGPIKVWPTPCDGALIYELKAVEATPGDGTAAYLQRPEEKQS